VSSDFPIKFIHERTYTGISAIKYSRHSGPIFHPTPGALEVPPAVKKYPTIWDTDTGSIITHGFKSSRVVQVLFCGVIIVICAMVSVVYEMCVGKIGLAEAMGFAKFLQERRAPAHDGIIDTGSKPGNGVIRVAFGQRVYRA